MIGAKPARAWSALERGLVQYLETLTKRKDALEQTAALAKQNEELRGCCGSTWAPTSRRAHRPAKRAVVVFRVRSVHGSYTVSVVKPAVCKN